MPEKMKIIFFIDYFAEILDRKYSLFGQLSLITKMTVC